MINSSIQKKLSICGMGPGSREYVLPIVFELVSKSQLVIAGKRHLDMVKPACRFFEIGNNMLEVYNEISTSAEYSITVLVSGDTGFYSAFSSIKNNVNNIDIAVYPGISSFQYFYAKIGKSYESAFLSSIHGVDFDFISVLKQYSSVFLLTDLRRNWKLIASELIEKGLGDCTMYVGNRLSYSDEEIVYGTAYELGSLEYNFNLCSVIIEYVDK